jgi:hypothetical protein
VANQDEIANSPRRLRSSLLAVAADGTPHRHELPLSASARGLSVSTPGQKGRRIRQPLRDESSLTRLSPCHAGCRRRRGSKSPPPCQG